VVVRGYFNYHAVPTNSRAMWVFSFEAVKRWQRILNRRSQQRRFTWARMIKLAIDYVPKPLIIHAWPNQRFAVRHPRQEPYAGKSHVRIGCSEASCHSSG
jgi:hypothetical protein